MIPTPIPTPLPTQRYHVIRQADLRVGDAQAENLTGLLAEEMIDKPCYEAVQGECEGGNSFCAYLCGVIRLAEAGQSAPSYDVCLFTRSGGKRWVNVSHLTVDNDEGPYLAIWVIVILRCNVSDPATPGAPRVR